VKALVLNGGGRRGGFTTAMCGAFSASLEKEGWDVCELFLLGLDIGHCTGCEQCRSSDGCVISDGMTPVYGMLEECDLLVMAAPVRFSGPSSMLKTAIDRFQPLWHHRKEGGGYAAGMLCGGSAAPNFGNTLTVIRSFAATAGMSWAGDTCFPGTDRALITDAETQAAEFGRRVADGFRGTERR
jgi:multimeric flavodoxin WrbA